MAAESAGKARHIIVASLKDIGYTESAQYKNVRVVRLKKYDAWAQTTKNKCVAQDNMQRLL